MMDEALEKSKTDSNPLLLVDWRWRPPDDESLQNENIGLWLRGFEECFGTRPLIISPDRPFSLSHRIVATLVERLADHPTIGLHITSLLDQPVEPFLRVARLLGGRLFISAHYKHGRESRLIFIERLMELRDAGMAPALIWQAPLQVYPSLVETINAFSDYRFAVCLLPPERLPWESPVPDKWRILFFRFTSEAAIRWLFMRSSILGKLSVSGRDFITVHPDGSVFPAPEDVLRRLGNILDGDVRLIGGATAFPVSHAFSLNTVLSLDEAALPPVSGNPVSAFLEGGGVKATKDGVDYPYRHSDWEDGEFRSRLGLPPAGSSIAGSLVSEYGHQIFKTVTATDKALIRTLKKLPVLKRIVSMVPEGKENE